MKRKFIINPSANNGNTKKRFEFLKSFFLKTTCEFDYVITKNEEHVKEVTCQCLYDGYEQIVPVGGDGTIHHVVNGFFDKGKLINPNACLAISNEGTGSDFYKTVIGIDDNKDWKWNIFSNARRQVDVGMIDYLKRSKNSRYFINMAGLGISADIVQSKEKLPAWIPSKLKYILPTVLASRRLPSYNVELSFGINQQSVDIIGLFLSNGVYAGGGMKFAKNAEIDDGKLNALLIKKMSRQRILKNLKILYSGNFENLEGIELFTTSQIEVNANEKLPAELDGEFIGTGSYSISMAPEKISVCIPETTIK